MFTIFKNFLSILNLENKRIFFLLSFLSIFGAILEMIGVGILIPIVVSIIDPNGLQFLKNIKLFENYNNNEILLIILIFLLFFFILKSFFITILYKKIFYWIGDFSCQASTKIFKNHISQNYPFFFKINSAHIIQSLTRNITLLGERILQPVMLIIVEGSVVIFLAIFLLFFNLKATVAVMLFTIFFSLLFIKLVKNKLIKGGEEIQKFDALRIKKIQESLGSIKEIKMTSLEDKIVEEYFSFSKILRNSQAKHDFLLQTPKIIIELAIVFFFVGFIFFSVQNNILSTSIITTLSAFAFATFKITPAVNRILLASQRLFNTKKSLATLTNDLNLAVPQKKLKKHVLKEITFSKIQLKNISFAYNDKSQNLFKNYSLDILKGEIVGISGRSGSGKTTLIDIIVGLLKPTTGEILINNFSDTDMEVRKKIISYVPQDVYIFDNSIKNNITLSENFNENMLKKVSKVAMIDEFLINRNLDFDTLVGEKGILLSGGQKQRIGIARALYRNPKVLILDEATNALDESTEKEFFKNLKEFNNEITIILVSHRRNTLEISSRIIDL